MSLFSQCAQVGWLRVAFFALICHSLSPAAQPNSSCISARLTHQGKTPSSMQPDFRAGRRLCFCLLCRGAKKWLGDRTHWRRAREHQDPTLRYKPAGEIGNNRWELMGRCCKQSS
jgi:hypothetical protein